MQVIQISESGFSGPFLYTSLKLQYGNFFFQENVQYRVDFLLTFLVV